MKYTGDLSSTFFLILVITGGAYLLLSGNGLVFNSAFTDERARELAAVLLNTGKRLEAVSGFFKEMPPISLVAGSTNALTGYPEGFLSKAGENYLEARSLIPLLKYHSLRLQNLLEQKNRLEKSREKGNESDRSEKRTEYVSALTKEIDAAQREYQETASSVSLKISRVEENLKRAVIIVVGVSASMAVLGGMGICTAIIHFPRLKGSRDSVLELRIKDTDIPSLVKLPRADPTSIDICSWLRERDLFTNTAAALLGILAAHPKVPASIEGHAPAELGLIQHTCNTVRLVLDNLPKDIEPNTMAVAAIAHDIGKILAYLEEGRGQWVRTGLYHDRLSASILLSLAEFHAEFEGEEKTAILAAIRYHHALLDMPVNSPPLTRKIFDLLQKADSTAAVNEKQETAESIAPHVYSSFTCLLPELNINGYRGKPVQGYTLEGSSKIVLVYEHALREGIIAGLPSRLRANTPLARPANRIHPVWPMIASVLTEKGALVRKVNDTEADDNCFFAAEIEVRPGKNDIHRCLVALNGEIVPPEIWSSWTAAAGSFHPKVMKSNA